MIVRFLLLGALAIAVFWVVRSPHSHRRQAIVRVGVLAVAATWTVAVLRPDSVTTLANAIGVGRGTDLLLYLLIVAFTFAMVGLYRKVRDLEDQIADLTRAQAHLEHQLEAPETRGPRGT